MISSVKRKSCMDHGHNALHFIANTFGTRSHAPWGLGWNSFLRSS